MQGLVVNIPPEQAPPPSYAAATNQQASSSVGISYHDILPHEINDGMLPMQYENLRTLVIKANIYLKENPYVQLLSIETLPIKQQAQCITQPEKMIFTERGKGRMHFLLCLRLWLVRRSDFNQPPQEISYQTYIPSPWAGDIRYNHEKLDNMLTTINDQLTIKPIPGKYQ